VHPVLFRLGNIEFYSYGLMIGIGFVAGIWLASKRAEKKGIDPDSMFWLFVLLLAAGMVGGRLFHVVLNTWYYQDWRSVLDTRNGGLSIHGVLVGGALALAAYARSKEARFLDLADLLAPSVALGQAIGRIGCFMSGCCYGVETSGTWGFYTRFAPGLRHPYQIYESLANFILVVAVIRVSDKTKVSGTAFWTYVAGYSGIRFFLEFFRDNDSYLWGLSYGQWTSLAGLAAALVIVIYSRAKSRSQVPQAE
jgi:phosphatidylglycerol:prolipoprotein diacylglycerol transferase